MLPVCGADEEIRTPNRRIRSAVLYPLSYIRVAKFPLYYTHSPPYCKDGVSGL